MNSLPGPRSWIENVCILLIKLVQVTTNPHYQMDKGEASYYGIESSSCHTFACLSGFISCHSLFTLYFMLWQQTMHSSVLNHLSYCSLPLGICLFHSNWYILVTFRHLTSSYSFISLQLTHLLSSRKTDPHLLIKEITLPLYTSVVELITLLQLCVHQLTDELLEDRVIFISMCGTE